MKPKILVFAGSTRQDSFNKKLAKIGLSLTQSPDVETTYLDLRDIPMPLYDGDLEESEGIPENAMHFRKYLNEHQGFLIVCPEYNSSISGVLKNAIDWASRPIPDEPPLLCFKGKVIALMSASPGKLGGLRGLVTVRSIFGNIGSIVLPTQVAIPEAYRAFDENGQLVQEQQLVSVKNVVQELVSALNKFVE